VASAAKTPKGPPRMLKAPDAASYCGVSVPTFKTYCPVKPIRLGKNVLWDRVQLNRWLDALSAPCSVGTGTDWIGRLENADAY
jgi:hypothetical protein